MADGDLAVLVLLAAVAYGKRSSAPSSPVPAPSSPAPRAPSSPAPAPRLPQTPSSSGPVPWSDDDLREYKRIGTGLGLDATDLEQVLLLFAVASGLHPSQGLIRPGAKQLKAVGWKADPRAFLSLSVQRQLPWVAKVLERAVIGLGRKPSDASEWYALGFAPSAVKARADVLYTREANPAEYQRLQDLDIGGKGWVSMADVRARVSAVQQTAIYLSHVARLRGLR